MITGKTLYDSNGQQFYPYSDAEYISSGVVADSNMLKADLIAINNKADQALLQSSGAQAVSGSLQVTVKYICSTESTETNIKLITDDQWSDKMTLPNSSTPYCWKRTQYHWKINEKDTPQVIKTIYEICATALYPETQVMYTVTSLINSDAIGGPNDYSTSIQGIGDSKIPTMTWFNTFPGISATDTMGYMATRHREAGQNWPDNGKWKVALFAVYPTT